MRETEQEREDRRKALIKIAPIREKYFELLRQSKKERIDRRTIKIIMK